MTVTINKIVSIISECLKGKEKNRIKKIKISLIEIKNTFSILFVFPLPLSTVFLLPFS
jgi:hypothetical protein